MERVNLDYDDDPMDQSEAGAGGSHQSLAQRDPWLHLPELGPTRAASSLWTGGKGGAALNMLRTRVSSVMAARQWTSLAVTGPTTGCGTTTLAANLALSLSRRPATRVVLVDFNMRQPAVATTLGIETKNAIEHFLNGSVSLERSVLRYNGNLAILPNGRTVNHSSDLIQSAASVAALQNLRQALVPAFVIFDLPPMLEADDMLAFLPQVDCVLLAAGAEISTLEQIDLCERELSSRDKLLGVVLNRCKFADEYPPR